MATYCWGMTLNVSCGLTVCTQGSAPGPTLSEDYGRTLPFCDITGFTVDVIEFCDAVNCWQRDVNSTTNGCPNSAECQSVFTHSVHHTTYLIGRHSSMEKYLGAMPPNGIWYGVGCPLPS